MLIETHCHLDFPEFDPDREEVIERAREAGVARLINIGSSLKGSRDSVALSQGRDFIYAAVGFHPHHAGEFSLKVLEELEVLARRPKVVAVGEVGLDYHYPTPSHDEQKEVFRHMLRLSHNLSLPLILHAREANPDFINILKEELKPPLNGVLHCFSGDKETAKEYLDSGLHISFTCNITFKKADDLREIVKFVPIERILLETDSPYLAPQALRGKRNEPSYLKYLVEELSRLKRLSCEDIERITTLNAARLFNINLQEEKGKIAYPIRDALYLNITNRCTGGCIFCVRTFTDYVKGHNLRLDTEPTAEEILKAVDETGGRYHEAVFCGYGEPTIRLDVILEVARKLKEKGYHVRLDTNGHGNLIHKRSIAGDLAGLIDEVCVSLNAPDKEEYNRIVRPPFGPDTFDRVKDFIIECRNLLPKVEITAVALPGLDLSACEKVAREELKVGFRVREYNEVG